MNSSPPNIYLVPTNLFVPDEQYAAGVFSRVSEAAVYVLHEDVCLFCIEGVHGLFHVCGSESCQDIQHNVEVPLLDEKE